jgi:soluble lytic murein transglycosylase-like protein
MRMKSMVKAFTVVLAGAALTGLGTADANAGPPDVKNVPEAYVQWIRQAAGTCDDVNGPLLAAQIEQESNWDPNAVSSAGAQGIAQFKPDTWAAYGVDGNGNGKTDPFEPEDAILAQGKYMCALATEIQSVPADRATAMLWAYNAGPQATKDANGQAPTAEADNYARRILTELVPKYTP